MSQVRVSYGFSRAIPSLMSALSFVSAFTIAAIHSLATKGSRCNQIISGEIYSSSSTAHSKFQRQKVVLIAEEGIDQSFDQPLFHNPFETTLAEVLTAGTAIGFIIGTIGFVSFDAIF